MDTLDNAEALERQDAERNKGMVAGAARLVQAIRARFPDMAIMMNRGYALLPQVAGRIDIVLAEAMASRWHFAEGRYEIDRKRTRLNSSHSCDTRMPSYA